LQFLEKEIRKRKKPKSLKHIDHKTDVQRMWKVKAKGLPVTTGATVPISESFRKYLSHVPGNHDIKELLKTATLATALVLRKVLM
jgi:hypothetical protein